MANGTYGIRKPAQVSAADLEIFYHYRPTRGSEAPGFAEWKALNAESVFSPCEAKDGTGAVSELSGMYNLRLPLEEFGKKGIYTIYIKPKEVKATIYDVSTLTGNYTSVRGIVFDTRKINGINTDNGSLVGYRVEYLDDNGAKSSDYRIITSNNKCEPVSQNVNGSAMQKAVRYRFHDSSSLTFCTLTPSTAMSFKTSALPYIGTTGQEVRLINTKFNPVMLEIEMVSHDADTISTMLEGSQLRNLDNGIITTFDEDGNIYHQAAYGNIVNPDTGMHTDFKIKYGSSYIRSEEDKFDEIRREVVNGQQI